MSSPFEGADNVEADTITGDTDNNPEEEYYARQSRLQRRSFDNRTGRRTRRRSGPGPPNPEHRVPADLNALLRTGVVEVSASGNLGLVEQERLRVLEHRRIQNHVVEPQWRNESGVAIHVNTTQSRRSSESAGVRMMNTTTTTGSRRYGNRGLTAGDSVVKCKSSLTRYLERTTNDSSKKPVVRPQADGQITESDKVKFKMIAAMKCCKCKMVCLPPILRCEQAHLMCEGCRANSASQNNGRLVCHECRTLIGRPLEVKQFSDFLKQISFTCLCGTKVSVKNLPEHQLCLTKPPSTLDAMKCEFCKMTVNSNQFGEHINTHFSLSVENKLNPKNKRTVLPVYEKMFDDLPLDQTLGVMPSLVTKTLIEDDHGLFQLHQIRVDMKKIVWIVSFECKHNGPSQSSYNASDFMVTLRFTATSKGVVYKKICHAMVYPMFDGLEERKFLEYVGRCLPDAWTPTFKFAYGLKINLIVQIHRFDGNYIRRFSTTHMSSK